MSGLVEKTTTAVPAVRMAGIVKRFGTTLANDNVRFSVAPGEIHALLGENGAGKSTLMNILAGVYAPDEGTVELFGKPARFNSPRDAIRNGIGMVHQHFAQVPGFSTAQNLALAALDTPPFFRRKDLEGKAKRLAEAFNIDLHPAARTEDLSVGERQRLELLRLLAADAKILILDEPTAVLTTAEAEALFGQMRDLAARGRAVIFITHKLDEVEACAHRITILRNGRVVADSIDANSVRREEIADMMVGRSAVEEDDRKTAAPGATVFEFKDAWAKGARGAWALAGVSMQVRAGEILAIAGVSGNGQRELAEAAMGLRRLKKGEKIFSGESARSWKPARMRAAGTGFVPEDRMRLGICPSLSVEENLVLDRFGPGARFFINATDLRRRALALAASTQVSCGRIEEPIRSLSGGNVQRVILAREMASGSKLLIVSQPTRGLDITSASEVRRALLAQRDRGVAILLISYDLDEICQLADRMAVMLRGALVAKFDRPFPERVDIGLAMTGGPCREN